MSKYLIVSGNLLETGSKSIKYQISNERHSKDISSSFREIVFYFRSRM